MTKLASESGSAHDDFVNNASSTSGARLHTVDSDNANVRVSRDLCADGIDVGLVVGGTVVGNAILSVGGKGSAITLWHQRVNKKVVWAQT